MHRQYMYTPVGVARLIVLLVAYVYVLDTVELAQSQLHIGISQLW